MVCQMRRSLYFSLPLVSLSALPPFPSPPVIYSLFPFYPPSPHYDDLLTALKTPFPDLPELPSLFSF